MVIRMAGEEPVTRDDAIFAALARGETVAITRFAVSTPTIALLAFISAPPGLPAKSLLLPFRTVDAGDRGGPTQPSPLRPSGGGRRPYHFPFPLNPYRVRLLAGAS